MKRYGLRLPEDLVEEVTSYGKARELVWSEAVRVLIERGLKRVHLDIEDPAAVLTSVRDLLLEIAEKQGRIEAHLQDLTTEQEQATRSAEEAADQTRELLTWADTKGAYDRESLEMVAQLSVIGRMFVKSRFPAEFPELKGITERQMQIVEKGARERFGRIEGGDKGK